jgi:CheY-like chemotaxis protein
MVIGNDSHFCYLMHSYVRKSANQIMFAYPGEDVLALARCERPAAIILALETTGTMGWNVLRALKTDQETGNIPVVVCSWLDEEKRSLEEGADIYLRLPILYEDFSSALSALGIPCA